MSPEVVFMLEEPSMRELLQELLPRVMPPGVETILIAHQGKSDLEISLSRKLRAWRVPNSHFIILRDKDRANCVAVKRRLTQICREAGRPDAVVRIVCHELESWFLGDLAAVGVAFDLPDLHAQAAVRKFRDPDRLGSPSHEMKKLVVGYQKMSGARRIGPHLHLEGNRSHSFNVFLLGLRRILARLMLHQAEAH